MPSPDAIKAKVEMTISWLYRSLDGAERISRMPNAIKAKVDIALLACYFEIRGHSPFEFVAHEVSFLLI